MDEHLQNDVNFHVNISLLLDLVYNGHFLNDNFFVLRKRFDIEIAVLSVLSCLVNPTLTLHLMN